MCYPNMWKRIVPLTDGPAIIFAIKTPTYEIVYLDVTTLSLAETFAIFHKAHTARGSHPVFHLFESRGGGDTYIEKVADVPDITKLKDTWAELTKDYDPGNSPEYGLYTYKKK